MNLSLNEVFEQRVYFCITLQGNTERKIYAVVAI